MGEGEAVDRVHDGALPRFNVVLCKPVVHLRITTFADGNSFGIATLLARICNWPPVLVRIWTQ